MNLTARLSNLASVSTGSARAVYESAGDAYRAIFESEADELEELGELGEEIGDDLEKEADDGTAEDKKSTDEPKTEDEQEVTGPEQEAGIADDLMKEPDTQEPAPETINAQSQPASVSADALIDELLKLGYDEKIRSVAQRMKQAQSGNVPDAEDMVKPVAQAISKYMTKKGYAGMQKDAFEKVVKTVIMHATDVKRD